MNPAVHVCSVVSVKENQPKRSASGSFKFSFSHSAGAANTANGSKPPPAASSSRAAAPPSGQTRVRHPVPKVRVFNKTRAQRFLRSHFNVIFKRERTCALLAYSMAEKVVLIRN